MWPTTRLTNLLGIEHPIVQAPMAGACTPELVAAVSNAGGLGSYGAAAAPPAKLREVIQRIRALTDRPFAVNLFAPSVEHCEVSAAQLQAMARLLAPWHEELGAGPVPDVSPIIGPFDEQLTVLLEERVPVFSFHFGPPPLEAIERAHAAGARVMASATTVREARMLADAGVDAIVAQGAEAGGHRATFAGPSEQALTGTLGLVPQIVDAVSLPVIAAGGIMDARGIVAAFALGASGVQMGTAFLACPENSIPPVYKEAVLRATDEDTVVTEAFSGRPARAVRNRYVEEMAPHRDKVLPFPAQMSIGRALRQASARAGRPDFVSIWAGQAARLARARPAAQLMDEWVRECGALLASLGRAHP
ncbi:MAG TPA: nitronate monooxygenase [Burkholderiales bacterium]